MNTHIIICTTCTRMGQPSLDKQNSGNMVTDLAAGQRVVENMFKASILKRVLITHLHFQVVILLCAVLLLLFDDTHTKQLIHYGSSQDDLIPNRTRARSTVATYNSIISNQIKSHNRRSSYPSLPSSLTLFWGQWRAPSYSLLCVFVCFESSAWVPVFYVNSQKVFKRLITNT